MTFKTWGLLTTIINEKYKFLSQKQILWYLYLKVQWTWLTFSFCTNNFAKWIICEYTEATGITAMKS